MTAHRIAILGAGPIGLDAALAAAERGWDATLYEAGERDGRPFRLLVRSSGPSADGGERIEHADAVLDCTGTYTHPNPLGDGGIPAPGETALDDRIVRRVPDVAADPGAWAGRTTLLVGGGHSAQSAARDLARLAEERADGTRVIWALRSAAPPCWRIEDDPLPARAALAGETEALVRGASPALEPRLGVAVAALRPSAERDGAVEVTLRPSGRGAQGGNGTGGGSGGEPETVTVDRVLALTGSVGDDRLYRQLQVHECFATGAPMKLSAALLGAAGGGGDCMAQSGFGPETLTNPEPRFFILGAKSYGRNSAFLMRIGWQQVDDAFALLATSFERG